MYWPQAVLARSLSEYCLFEGAIQRIRWPVVPSHLIRLVSGRMMNELAMPALDFPLLDVMGDSGIGGFGE